MTLIADASIALTRFVEEDASAGAAALLTTPELLVAPDPVVTEVWKVVRPGAIAAFNHPNPALPERPRPLGRLPRR